MEADRQKWLGTLEIIAVRRPDEAEAEWAWVMKELGLGPDYFLAIYEAVRKGGWQEAENPAGYIKTVARREARLRRPDGEKRRARGLRGVGRMEANGEEITLGMGDSFDSDGERFTSEEMLDHLEYRQDSGKPVRGADGVWRSAAGWGADNEGLFRAVGGKPRRGKMPTKAGLARYAERIRRMQAETGKDERDEPYMEHGPEVVTDWPKWAEEAGLSGWEKKAVEYKAGGVGWTDAMAAQPDEASRRALQAAWRKVERTGLARLEEALGRLPGDTSKDT